VANWGKWAGLLRAEAAGFSGSACLPPRPWEINDTYTPSTAHLLGNSHL